MHGIVQAFGVFVFVLGFVVAILSLGAGFTGVMAGASMVVSGAVLFCFGTMVEHLNAIRKSNDAMLTALQGLGKRLTPTPAAEPSRPAMSPRRSEPSEASGRKWPD